MKRKEEDYNETLAVSTFDELKRLASEDAAKNLTELFLIIMLDDQLRITVTDDQVRLIDSIVKIFNNAFRFKNIQLQIKSKN